MSIITNANKPFCKFCFDSGKPDYNTHWLRETMDKKSVVCCPELKKIKCRYCKEAGHTISYCKVLKEKERQSSLSKRTKPSISSDGFTMVIKPTTTLKKKSQVKISTASLSGMFAALECEDADEERPATEIRALKTSFEPMELEPTSSYLQAVKYGIRAAPELEKEFHTDQDQDQDQDQGQKPELKLVYERGAINWADECE